MIDGKDHAIWLSHHDKSSNRAPWLCRAQSEWPKHSRVMHEYLAYWCKFLVISIYHHTRSKTDTVLSFCLKLSSPFVFQLFKLMHFYCLHLRIHNSIYILLLYLSPTHAGGYRFPVVRLSVCPSVCPSCISCVHNIYWRCWWILTESDKITPHRG